MINDLIAIIKLNGFLWFISIYSFLISIPNSKLSTFNCFPFLSRDYAVHSNTCFSTTFKSFTVIRKFYPFKDSL